MFAGGLGSIGLGGLGTLSGLTRQTTAVKTAAERAAEAAARIPDPPAGTPRQKPKSVTFIEDGKLACVRYFFKVLLDLACMVEQEQQAGIQSSTKQSSSCLLRAYIVLACWVLV